MYISKENKKKVLLSFVFIALSTASIIAGKTLATGIILSAYPTSILPYFYFALSILLILTTIITSKYQEKYQKNFAIIIKFIYLIFLLIFIGAIKLNMPGTSFIISILVLSFSSIIPLIAWNYASDIFNIQEFKRYSNIFQLSSSVGAISVGGIIAIISTKHNPIIILAVIFLSELLSLFCIKPLSKYLPAMVQTPKKPLNYSSKLWSNSIYKYISILSITAMIMATVIDYSLKLSLTTTIDKQAITGVVNLIYVISMTAVLLLQIFFLDYLLRILGSKKIIIIYPLALLIVSLVTLFNSSFIGIVILFLVNDIFFYTTFSLSKNLYTNILPLALKSAARIKLNGIIKPIAWIIAAFIVWLISLTINKLILCVIIVITLSAYSLYLTKILIKKYLLQLTQSVNLRRFKPELINMSQIDKKDFDYLLKQALSYPDPEATLFGLQLLSNDKAAQLPDSLALLLNGEDPSVTKAVAKLLSNHRNQRQFVDAAMDTFSKSTDEETKWYLALYLIKSESNNFLHWANIFLQHQTNASLAMVCLIFLKQGDLKQQIFAMELLTQMFSSTSIEQKKWFLLILGEISFIQKEKYLTQLIQNEIPAIQILALQHIPAKHSDQILDTLLNHIGVPFISYAVSSQLIKFGERTIDKIEEKFYQSDSYRIKFSCIQIINQITGTKSELCLFKILSTTENIFIKTTLAKYLAFRGVKLKISPILKEFLIDSMKTEVQQFYLLSAQLIRYDHLVILDEINSRLQLVKTRILYYLTAIIGSIDVLNSVALLTSSKLDKNQQAIALEIIDATSEDRVIASLLMLVFIEIDPKKITSDTPINDPWLTNYIHKIESNDMELIYTLTKLRKIELFKNLPAETLQVLAECCSSRDMIKGEIIFQEGEQGDGLYIIDSGDVSVMKQQIEINRLTEHAYFGEMALISDSPRFATVTALSDGVLFFIGKQDFDRITDEIPEIMKNISKQIINYLATNAAVLTAK